MVALRRGDKEQELCFIVSWKEEGQWYLLQQVQKSHYRIRVLCPLLLFPWVPRRIKKISIRLAQFYLPFWAFLFIRSDIVISWDLTTGVVGGLLKRLLPASVSSSSHVVRDFHINRNKESFWYKGKLFFLRKSLPGIDHIWTTSTDEIALYSRMFQFPEERISFFPDGPRAELVSYSQPSPEEFIVSYGNSDRDFEVLTAIADQLALPLFIISQKLSKEQPCGENVTVINDFLPYDELFSYISRARCVIVPLQFYNVAAGQNSMLEVMMLTRPLIISQNIAIKDYGRDGETMLLFEPGNKKELFEKISWVLSHRDEAEQMAARGREYAVALLDGAVGCFFDLLERVKSRK